MNASFANINNGCGSIGGQLIFLSDKKGKVALINWHSGKVKRVVRSTLAAETLSLVEGLEDAIFHRMIVSELSGKKSDRFDIKAVIDNRSCVEALNSTHQVEDKRLRIEIGEIKEMIFGGVVKDISWVPGSAQIADALTKAGASGLRILEIVQNGQF